MGQTTLTRSHRRYRQLRARVRRDHPLCVHCAAHGLTVAGTDVDHIIPLAHGGRLMDRANLQHLCAACHDAKTRQQQGGDQSTRRLRHGHQAPPNVHTRNQVRRLRQAWRAFAAELC